jgi:dTDP-4-amino-4,6-dideoxygalactose transaminase
MSIIPVTKSFLPPVDEYSALVKRAWENQWLTNRGELVLELEEKLKAYLGVNNIIITNNGTIPLQIAVKLLAENSEIITTPFSYIATTSSIIWEGKKPVFVDIHPEYLTIDETKIEAAITPQTSAIMATHVFGNPCAIEVIAKIAQKHKLKVIYDAAHCFGVKYNGESIFNFGDVSTCSFHATKLFHTAEGGAVFCKDESLRKKFYYSHNFGHDGPLSFHGLGINGKISELQGAMGLAVLPYMEHILNERKRVVTAYNEQLNFDKIRKIRIREKSEWNYSYYPLIMESEEALLKVLSVLNSLEIYPRRYFYPSLNTVDYIIKLTRENRMPVSESIASRIMCLPLYADLSNEQISLICKTINGNV